MEPFVTDAIRLLLYDGRTISDAAAQLRVVVNKERHYGADCGRTLWCFALEKDTTGVSLICTFLFVFLFLFFVFFRYRCLFPFHLCIEIVIIIRSHSV